jgi:hypothetical protein
MRRLIPTASRDLRASVKAASEARQRESGRTREGKKRTTAPHRVPALRLDEVVLDIEVRVGSGELEERREELLSEGELGRGEDVGEGRAGGALLRMRRMKSVSSSGEEEKV